MVKLTTLTNLILTGCHRQEKKNWIPTSQKVKLSKYNWTSKVNVKILLESKTNTSDLQGGLYY